MPTLADMPDTDDMIVRLKPPHAGAHRVIVCHPVEADHVAAAVRDRFGAVDRVTFVRENGEPRQVHTDESASFSVHVTERVPAGKAFTWTKGAGPSPEQVRRWTNAPGEMAPGMVSRALAGEQGTLEGVA